jgi:organic radical activating enzyme
MQKNKDFIGVPLAVDSLPLMEAFYTIQGEGYWQGVAAYFIRLAGCEVGCVWCDVKESWSAEGYPKHSPEEITEILREIPAKTVVVTGGEPAMYDLSGLTAAIQKLGKRTHIETSGVYPITGSWDWICFSPKKFKTPHESAYTVANELKVVIYHPSDLAWAEEHAAKVHGSCALFLQPEWSKRDEMHGTIVDYVKQNPKWNISIQSHKYLDIP